VCQEYLLGSLFSYEFLCRFVVGKYIVTMFSSGCSKWTKAEKTKKLAQFFIGYNYTYVNLYRECDNTLIASIFHHISSHVGFYKQQ